MVAGAFSGGVLTVALTNSGTGPALNAYTLGASCLHSPSGVAPVSSRYAAGALPAAASICVIHALSSAIAASSPSARPPLPAATA